MPGQLPPDCPGHDLPNCATCARRMSEAERAGQQVAPMYARRRELEPRVSEQRCLDFYEAPR